MPAFLYFMPAHETPVSLADLRAWQLDYAFERVPYHARVQGPTGSGTLLVDDRRLEPLTPTYRPEEQTWKRQPGADFWVGWYQHAIPTIEDLERPEQLPGDRVELADGHRWLVPLVRQVRAGGASEPALPCYLDLDDEGQLIRGAIAEQHTWLWDQCAPFWDAWLAGIEAALARVATLPADATSDEIISAGQFAIECDTLLADAVRVLSGNYRIGLREALALKLFRTDQGPAEILKAACDTELATLYLQKKSAAAMPAA